ncbi:MAG: DUF4907 domain-containing protein [Bacteroidota bacterium]
MIRINKGRILWSVMLVLSYSCNSSDPDSKQISSSDSISTQKIATTYRVFMNDSTNKSKGYGYEINGGMHILQKSIPAVNGNQLFQMEDDAGKVAALVCSKIQNNQLPTITMHELDSLGVTVNKMQ